jgi:hypothetical protein
MASLKNHARFKHSSLVNLRMSFARLSKLAMDKLKLPRAKVLYVKEEKRLRVSADVYCQNQNTRLGSHINIL